MSPELITAVKERIEHGHTDEEIRQELVKAGHAESVIAEVMQSVRSGQLVETDSTASQSPNSTQTPPPSIKVLVKEGFGLLLKRHDLFLALGLPFALVAIIGFFTTSTGQVATLGLVGLVAVVWYVLAMTATLYIITNSSERTISLSEGIIWARSHIWRLGWIYFLTTVITYGGYMLFVIPGIIVSVFIFFTPYVYVCENVSGLSAVLRSRDLVRGRWGQVFGLLFKLMVIFMVALMGMGLLSLPLAFVFSAEIFSELIIGTLFQLFGAVLTIIGFYVGMKIYRWLVATAPVARSTANTSQSSRWQYILLACLGLVFPVLLVVALGVYVASEGREDFSYLENIESDIKSEIMLDKSSKERLREMGDFDNL